MKDTKASKQAMNRCLVNDLEGNDSRRKEMIRLRMKGEERQAGRDEEQSILILLAIRLH